MPKGAELTPSQARSLAGTSPCEVAGSFPV